MICKRCGSEDMIELRPAYPGSGDGLLTVFSNGDWLGDLERLADDTWVGDVTQGNGPPSKPFATRDEALTYVVPSWREGAKT